MLARPEMHAALRRSMVRFNVDSLALREWPAADEIPKLHRYCATYVTMIDDEVGRRRNI